MYAINHAATALVIKKKYLSVSTLWLLLAVQAAEVLRVIFQFTGIEHISVADNKMHLDYLRFSHSLLTGIGGGLIIWLVLGKVCKRPVLGIALGIGIASHVLLDLTVHEPDIQIAPFIAAPRLGLNMYAIPLLAFFIETAYGIWCWWVYRGSKALLAIIILFNVLNLPFFFANDIEGVVVQLGLHPLMVATMVGIQIVLPWTAIWVFSRKATLESGQSPRATASRVAA
jgi:hypothetical protein